MENTGSIAMSGKRSFSVNRGGGDNTPEKRGFIEVLKQGLPTTKSRETNLYRWKNLINLWRGFWRIMAAKIVGVQHTYGAVYAKVIRANGEVLDLGLISLRVVTDTGVGFIVDAFQNLVELENMKFHGFGTGGTAEAASQTALVTELTTQYATDNVRPTGSTTEGAGANIYRTVATLSPDATVAITEHGVFSQAAVAGGVMVDRSLFSVINLVSGDSLQTTYDLTFPSAG